MEDRNGKEIKINDRGVKINQDGWNKAEVIPVIVSGFTKKRVRVINVTDYGVERCITPKNIVIV